MTANNHLASAPVVGLGSPPRAPRAKDDRPVPLSLAPGFSRVFPPAQPGNRFNGFPPTAHEAANTASLASPNGATPSQPRAKRSVALGSMANGNLALKGHTTGGAAWGNVTPLQGFGPSQTPTQGDALGWYGAAPLGLNRFDVAATSRGASPAREPRTNSMTARKTEKGLVNHAD